MSKIIGTKTAADILKITQEGVRWLIRNGHLKGERPGRDWIVDEDSVMEYKVEMDKRKEGKR